MIDSKKAGKFMKILFFGDSITDMERNREVEIGNIFSYGNGYPYAVACELFKDDPTKYTIINKGISGNRSVDLYARIKSDVWNLQPNLLSILIGVNDVWHELSGNGVEIDRFENVYSMIIAETMNKLPNTKILLMEPFVLKGSATEDNWRLFQHVYEYAEVVKRLADKYGVYFLPLQEKFERAAAKHGVDSYLYDGVHPNVAGAKLIADAWIEMFKERIQLI